MFIFLIQISLNWNKICLKNDHLPTSCKYIFITQVSGVVTDKHGTPHFVVSGTWDISIDYAKIVSVNNVNKSKPVYKTLPAVNIWQKYPLP